MTTKTVRRGSVKLHEEWGYLPIYLVNDKAPNDDGTCTLLVRRYEVVRTPKGNYRTHIHSDAMEFPDVKKMLHWIEVAEAKELPPEADGNPRFIPEELRGDPTIRQLLVWGAEDS